LANPDTTKYIIPTLQPKLATSGTGTSNKGTSTSTATTSVQTIAGPASTTSLAASTTTEPTVETTVQQEPPKFKFDEFASAQKLEDFKVVNGKRYVRYNPTGIGDFWIDESKNIYNSPGFGGIGE
jgi:hypothetical protein